MKNSKGNWCAWNNPQRLGKGPRRYQRKNEHHPDYSIIRICQNTEKNPEDLRRLTLNQNPLKDHQLTLVWKTREEYSRVSANGLGDWGSIPSRVIPKTLKMYLMLPCLTLNTIRLRSRVKLCKGRSPTLLYVVREIKQLIIQLAQKVYKNRHRRVRKVIHSNCARN